MTGLEIAALIGLGLLFLRPRATTQNPRVINRAGIAAQSSNQNQQVAINSAVQQNIQRILGGLRGQAAGARSATNPGGAGIGSGGTGTSNRPTQVNPGDPNLQVGDMTAPAPGQDLSSGLFTSSGTFVQSNSDGGLTLTLPSGDVASGGQIFDSSGSLVTVPVDTSIPTMEPLTPVPVDSNASTSSLDLSSFDGSGITSFDSGINSGGFTATDLGGVGL